MAKVCPPECLQIVLSAGCCGIPLLIEEDSVANDQRVLAHVSCEEARTYIRGVNAHHANGTKKFRMQMRACFGETAIRMQYALGRKGLNTTFVH